MQAYAAFMDGFLSTIFRLAVEDAKKEGAVPGPIVLVALGTGVGAVLAIAMHNAGAGTIAVTAVTAGAVMMSRIK